MTLRSMVSPLPMIALVAFVELWLASSADAQCWRSFGSSGGRIGCDPYALGKEECDVICRGTRCTCRTFGPPCGSAALPAPTQSLSDQELFGTRIDVCGGRMTATNQPSMAIALREEKLQIIESKSGLLALTLEAAFRAGGLENRSYEDAIFVSKADDGTVAEQWGYSGQVHAGDGTAIIDFRLEGHPIIGRMRATVRNRGNSGRVTFYNLDGTTMEQSW